jgi:hypothetical protein
MTGTIAPLRRLLSRFGAPTVVVDSNAAPVARNFVGDSCAEIETTVALRARTASDRNRVLLLLLIISHLLLGDCGRSKRLLSDSESRSGTWACGTRERCFRQVFTHEFSLSETTDKQSTRLLLVAARLSVKTDIPLPDS